MWKARAYIASAPRSQAENAEVPIYVPASCYSDVLVEVRIPAGLAALLIHNTGPLSAHNGYARTPYSKWFWESLLLPVYRFHVDHVRYAADMRTALEHVAAEFPPAVRDGTDPIPPLVIKELPFVEDGAILGTPPHALFALWRFANREGAPRLRVAVMHFVVSAMASMPLQQARDQTSRAARGLALLQRAPIAERTPARVDVLNRATRQPDLLETQLYIWPLIVEAAHLASVILEIVERDNLQPATHEPFFAWCSAQLSTSALAYLHLIERVRSSQTITGTQTASELDLQRQCLSRLFRIPNRNLLLQLLPLNSPDILDAVERRASLVAYNNAKTLAERQFIVYTAIQDHLRAAPYGVAAFVSFEPSEASERDTWRALLSGLGAVSDVYPDVARARESVDAAAGAMGDLGDEPSSVNLDELNAYYVSEQGPQRIDDAQGPSAPIEFEMPTQLGQGSIVPSLPPNAFADAISIDSSSSSSSSSADEDDDGSSARLNRSRKRRANQLGNPTKRPKLVASDAEERVPSYIELALIEMAR